MNTDTIEQSEVQAPSETSALPEPIVAEPTPAPEPVQQALEPAPVASPEPVITQAPEPPPQIDLSFVNMLTQGQWEAAHRRTEAKIAAVNPEPDKERYYAKSSSVHSKGSVVLIGGLLLLCFAFSWFVSSGKLIVVSDTYLSVLSGSPRLSSGYIDLSIVGYVLLAECGALTFMLASSMFPGEPAMLQGSKRSITYRPAVLIFRGAAISCAMIAIIANLTEMMLNWEALENIRVFAVLVTVVPPSFVLAIGFVVEKMYTQDRDRRAAAEAAFNTDYQIYAKYHATPTSHPDWMKLLYQSIFEAIVAAHPKYRLQLAELVSKFPQIRRALVMREINFRDDMLEVEVSRSNPIPASSSTSSYLPDGQTTPVLATGAS